MAGGGKEKRSGLGRGMEMEWQSGICCSPPLNRVESAGSRGETGSHRPEYWTVTGRNDLVNTQSMSVMNRIIT